MLGAIIGDIVGSRFEFHNSKTKDFELFYPTCRFTDDSVMTMAVGAALMEAQETGLLQAGGASLGGTDLERTDHTSEHAAAGTDSRTSSDRAAVADSTPPALENLFVKHMQKLGRAYPNAGYGGRFYDWIFMRDPRPYNSWGNGSGMRVSPCGEIARSLGEAAYLARKSAAVTHDHPEGIRGAEAIATAVFLARSGRSKEEIREHIERYYYSIDFTLDEIRLGYQFDVSCQGSVPQALEAFFESNGFEDAIRNAISIGVDSDTIGAMTGSIAESYYGLDQPLCERAMEYLTPELRDIVTRWYEIV